MVRVCTGVDESRMLFVYVFVLCLCLSIKIANGQAPVCPCAFPALETMGYHVERNITTSPLVLCALDATRGSEKVATGISSSWLQVVKQAAVELASRSGNGAFFLLHILPSTSSSEEQIRRCNVLLRVVTQVAYIEHQTHRPLCPGQCSPVPEVVVPHSWLEAASLTLDKFSLTTTSGAPFVATQITCSLTTEMLLVTSTTPLLVTDLLSILFWRRTMECFEEKHWHHYLHNASPALAHIEHILFARRAVESAVIWIGSTSRFELMQEQATMLLGQPHEGPLAVVGWAATDALYGCRLDSTNCAAGARGNHKFRFLPGSAMNFMTTGWRCAQRRPLRALAHVLLLIEPSFLVLLDDDTLLNYPMLTTRFGSYLQNDMQLEPIVMGEFVGTSGPTGHLSLGGIFAGGSGYVLGKRLLRALVAKEVFNFAALANTNNDTFRSHQQMKHLSVLADGLENSLAACHDNSSSSSSSSLAASSSSSLCISSVPGLELHQQQRHAHSFRKKNHLISNLQQQQQQQHMVPIGVRLVDFCANLMANEHTCQHSDHSIGRCFVYGAFASPISVICNSSVPLETAPKDLKIGLCFMATNCSPHMHITCHRYKPGGRGAGGASLDRIKALAATKGGGGIDLSLLLMATPVRISREKSHYKVFSSAFDGNMSDNFVR